MNKFRWMIFWSLCLLAIINGVRTYTVSQAKDFQSLTLEPVLSIEQQDTQSAVNLLLQDDVEQQALPSNNMQSILHLLLQDDEEQQQIFLPMIHR